jgi:hypothetical protein
MLSEEAFSAFWPEAPHLHKWPPLCILQPSSPKLREFQVILQNSHGFLLLQIAVEILAVMFFIA